jgi:hypothetical protein
MMEKFRGPAGKVLLIFMAAVVALGTITPMLQL